MESTEKALRTPCPRENARKSSTIALTSQISVAARPRRIYISANPPANTAIGSDAVSHPQGFGVSLSCIFFISWLILSCSSCCFCSISAVGIPGLSIALKNSCVSRPISFCSGSSKYGSGFKPTCTFNVFGGRSLSFRTKEIVPRFHLFARRRDFKASPASSDEYGGASFGRVGLCAARIITPSNNPAFGVMLTTFQPAMGFSTAALIAPTACSGSQHGVYSMNTCVPTYGLRPSRFDLLSPVMKGIVRGWREVSSSIRSAFISANATSASTS